MLPLARSRRCAQLCYSQNMLLLSSYFSSTTTTTDRRHGSEPIRPSPPPIQVLLTETAGRGVFATRNIETGELIHTAKPLVSHPSLSSINKVCYFCLKNIPKDSDFQAQKVLFCGEECREQAKSKSDLWFIVMPMFIYGFHLYLDSSDYDFSMNNCFQRTWGLKYPLLAKRLSCMVISGVTSADSLDVLQPALLSAEMISQMEEELGLLRGALEDAGMSSEQLTFLTNEWYIGVLARIRINAFRIELAGGSYEDLLASAAASVEAEATVGNAVYMLPSFYNHDCDPNTHIVWIQSADARLKALRDIEAGEELRICYIDASMDRNVRQNLLSKGFGFECHCPRCSSND